MRICWIAILGLLLPAWASAQADKRVVEDIVARVNNEIITLSDLQRGRSSLRREAEEECPSCTPSQIAQQVAEREKTVLRDLIDQSLLIQRGKDMGLSVEADVIKQLDEVRQRNNIPSMEELETQVTKSGLVWEDFKSGIRNRILTQEVIRREVGGRMSFGNDEIKKYYDEHKNDYVRPEMAYVSELFVTSEGKTPEEIVIQEQRARVLHDRLKKGEDFQELAKRYSDGSTAAQGGELGGFERGKLDRLLEESVFQLVRGQFTDVIRTQTGFLILRVDQRYEAGIQPVEKVENEIMNKLYLEKMQPSLREFLVKLREESYILIKPEYADPAVANSTPILEVAPVKAADEEGKKKRKRFLIF